MTIRENHNLDNFNYSYYLKVSIKSKKTEYLKTLLGDYGA